MLIAVIVVLLFIGFLFAKTTQKNEKSSKLSVSSKRYPLVFRSRAARAKMPVESFNENKGRSEAFFLRYLQKYFPKQVYIDMALPAGDAFYYPDFTLINKKNQLFVDIEIDEPYNFRGRPTHTQGSDDKRNAYFVESGWVVVRFAEEQIARQPLQCCKFLAQTLFQISNDKSFLQELQKAPDLTLMPFAWDRQAAQTMCANRTRESYGKVFEE
jgi:hypothetical protein